MNPGCCLNVSVVLNNSKNSSSSRGSTLNLFISTIGPASSSSCFSRVILSTASTIFTVTRIVNLDISVYIKRLSIGTTS